jgi:adenosylhomocysteine nucleosidase
MEFSTLVCFAVKEEAGPFRKLVSGSPEVKILITGMGRRNAERAITQALEKAEPRLVLTCGFAGGLRPGLATGTVLFSTEGNPSLRDRLVNQGIRLGHFHQADRVATTAAEKRALFEQTGADAVEMESRFISNSCRSKNIPCAIIRVILDAAEQDLPLDFNKLLDRNQAMDYWRLAVTLARTPGKIGALMKLQKQSRLAANKLAGALARIV